MLKPFYSKLAVETRNENQKINHTPPSASEIRRRRRANESDSRPHWQMLRNIESVNPIPHGIQKSPKILTRNTPDSSLPESEQPGRNRESPEIQ